MGGKFFLFLLKCISVSGRKRLLCLGLISIGDSKPRKHTTPFQGKHILDKCIVDCLRLLSDKGLLVIALGWATCQLNRATHPSIYSTGSCLTLTILKQRFIPRCHQGGINLQLNFAYFIGIRVNSV